MLQDNLIPPLAVSFKCMTKSTTKKKKKKKEEEYKVENTKSKKS